MDGLIFVFAGRGPIAIGFDGHAVHLGDQGKSWPNNDLGIMSNLQEVEFGLDGLVAAANTDGLQPAGKRAYMAVSNEKRALIMHAIDSLGMSVTEASKHYQVSRSTVSSIKQVYYAEDQRTDKKINRGKKEPKITEEQGNIIRQWIDNNCLLTLSELRRGCLIHFNKDVSQSTLSRLLVSFHYTIKRTSVVVGRASSVDVIQARQLYAAQYLTIMSRREAMYFIDETGFCVSMRRRVGRARTGERAVVHVPAIRTKNISLCAAYNIESMFSFEVEERPYNTIKFLAFIESILVKFREQSIISDILVMDNVAFHHSNCVRALIEGSGHRLVFLPAYSPFLNPIENVFNQWKYFVKQSQPSNENELLRVIEAGCRIITPEHCRNYFNNMETFLPRCLNGEEVDG